jgi:hypothetical protein
MLMSNLWCYTDETNQGGPVSKIKYDIRNGVKKIKTKTTLLISGATLGFAGLVMAVAMPLAAKAAGTVVVTPTNTQGWYIADQQAGGDVTYVSDPTSPMPTGALQLTTTDNNASKIQYLHNTTTNLSAVTDLSYATKHVSGPPVADPSYQLATCLGGVVGGSCVGFTTLVYEPYWNGAVSPGTWQAWDVDQGHFWSSASFTQGACIVVRMPGGPPTYTLAELQTSCPSAVVVAYGLNVGTFNPNYVVRTDAFTFNGTTYNFEVTNTPTDKDQCKNGGYTNYTDQSGMAFKNQGQCVSWTNGRGQ